MFHIHVYSSTALVIGTSGQSMENYIQSSAVANIRGHLSVNYLHIRHKRVEEQVNIARFGDV